MSYHLLRVLSVGLFTGLMLSCERQAKPAVGATPPAALAKAKPVVLNPEQRTKVEEAARHWVEQINSGEADKTLKDFDLPSLMKRTLDGIEVSAKIRSEVESGMLASVPKTRKSIAAQWSSGRARFLRIVDTEDGTVAKIRIDLENGGSSYLDLIPEMTPKGKVGIRDINNRSVGMLISESMRQALATILPKDQGLTGTFAKIFGATDSDETSVKQAQEFMDAATKNPNRAPALYEKLPLALKKVRGIYAIYLQVSQGAEEEYKKALEAGKKYFPKDPSLQFLLVDHYYLAKDFAAANQCVEDTMKALGEDGNLWSMRANLFKEMKQYDEADEAYLKSIAIEPDIMNHHSIGAQIAVNRSDYAEAVNRLKVGNKAIDDFIVFSKDVSPELDAFIDSDEYKAYHAKVQEALEAKSQADQADPTNPAPEPESEEK